jgi:AraC family transcriptional regulator of adaptative response/methylated-DNA-[protein]-cysteine methyltransferase
MPVFVRSASPAAAAVLAAFATEAERWAALRARDPAADGRFFYSVRTTGVYCYPSCAARPARPENVRFHASLAEAEAAGFRPCRRCRPDLPPRTEREAAVVAAACRRIEEAEELPSLSALAAGAGLSAHHFHRLFRRVAGVTPKAYADARRQARARDGLADGAAVTEAIYDAGYGSAGRFYESADAALGMTPSAFRAGGAGEVVRHAVGHSSLGVVLVAVSGRGICAILLGDDPAVLVEDLRNRFPRARHEAAEPAFASVVAEVVRLVDDPSRAPAPSLPLDVRGTAFQRRVWEALRAIPPGRTLTYAEVAVAIGEPRAVRAVAAACGANRLAVAVPCHRVVATGGALAGYRWGIERKRRLLEREGTGA